jgi:hypothetical protein
MSICKFDYETILNTSYGGHNLNPCTPKFTPKKILDLVVTGSVSLPMQIFNILLVGFAGRIMSCPFCQFNYKVGGYVLTRRVNKMAATPDS